MYFDKITNEFEPLYNFSKVLLENLPIAISVINPDFSVKYVNPAFERLTGYSSAEIIGVKPPYIWWDIKYIDKIKKVFKEMTLGKTTKAEVFYCAKSGKALTVIVTSTLFMENQQVKYYIANFTDVSKERKKERKIEYNSFHDNLTGIYNRAYFNEEIKRLSKGRFFPISIIIGDINSLKLVNDVFGHDKGDELLKKTAKIIKKCCRKEDVVSRWGGDEFSIILPSTDRETVRKIILRIKKYCKKETIIDLPISISLGSATMENDKQKMKSIIKEAEYEMYDTKLNESENITNLIIGKLEDILIRKNIENENHIKRLIKMAKKAAYAIKLKKSDLNNLKALCEFHDLGKITIPESIIMKAGDLLKEEYDMIKRNPITGSRILGSSPKIAHISELVLSCHERWDGLGYPRGLKGEEIPLLSRLFSIINSYDVMLHRDIPYKIIKTREEAIKELEQCAGTQFDPYLVNEFIKIA